MMSTMYFMTPFLPPFLLLLLLLLIPRWWWWWLLLELAETWVSAGTPGMVIRVLTGKGLKWG